MTIRRKKQLMKGKEVLMRNNDLEIGFISILKEHL